MDTVVKFLFDELRVAQLERIDQPSATLQFVPSSTFSEVYPTADRCISRADFPVLFPTEDFVEPFFSHHEGDPGRSLYATSCTGFLFDFAVMGSCITSVAYVDSWAEVALVRFISFWVPIASGQSATPNSFRSKA